MSSSASPDDNPHKAPESSRRVKPQEHVLVTWVSTASFGDEIPEPWGYAMKPHESVLRTLVALEVISLPAPGFDAEATVYGSGPAAKEWLEKHPEPDDWS
jgi:hypothetical protein